MLGLTRTKRWTDTDRVLAQAWSINSSLVCPGCGQFIDETTDMDGWHEVEEATCDGCRVLEEAQKGDTDPEPGLKRYVVRAVDYTRSSPSI